MSKEITAAMECPGCGNQIFYVEYHIPHCRDYPVMEKKTTQRPPREKKRSRRQRTES